MFGEYGPAAKASFTRLEEAIKHLDKAWEYWRAHPDDAEAAKTAHVYADQAQDIAGQTIAFHIAAEQYVVAFGISQPAQSWQYPIPLGAWDGLSPDQVRRTYMAAHRGDIGAAQTDWLANHQAGVMA